jgi:hypothetical protein
VKKLFLVLLLVAACSKKSTPTGTSTSALTTDAGFGATCSTDDQCASHVCWTDKQMCSLKCQSDAECPEPLTAGKCNKKGYCKRP